MQARMPKSHASGTASASLAVPIKDAAGARRSLAAAAAMKTGDSAEVDGTHGMILGRPVRTGDPAIETAAQVLHSGRRKAHDRGEAGFPEVRRELRERASLSWTEDRRSLRVSQSGPAIWARTFGQRLAGIALDHPVDGRFGAGRRPASGSCRRIPAVHVAQRRVRPARIWILICVKAGAKGRA